MSEMMLREAGDADVPFLTSTWLKSYRDAPAVRGVPNKVYYYYHHKVLEELLTRCNVMLYYYPGENGQQDTICSYICYEKYDSALIVHFLYTKKTFRKFGIAKKLIRELIEVEDPPAVLYTHKTKDIFPIERRLREKGWIYHPYMLWVSLPTKWENDG